MELTKADIQELLAEQTKLTRDWTKELLAEQTKQTKELLNKQSERFEQRTKEIVVEAINEVVMPVLNQVLEKQDETLDRVTELKRRDQLQETRLDDHDRRLGTLEATAQPAQA